MTIRNECCKIPVCVWFYSWMEQYFEEIGEYEIFEKSKARSLFYRMKPSGFIVYRYGMQNKIIFRKDTGIHYGHRYIAEQKN
jgi:hypothetical protein